VGSREEDVSAFKTMWSDLPRVTKEVYSPAMNETIDVSVTTQQFELRLQHDVAKTLQWQTVPTPCPSHLSLTQVQNQQIAHLIGSVSLESDTTPSPQSGQSKSQILVKHLPTLTFLPATTPVPPVRPLHIGQIRLLELKQKLQKAGHTVVLGEGVLICDNAVRVQKEEGGRGVRIEGVVGGRTYWEVRKAVYEGLAIV
jgi:Cleavage and polyadenylation factor 2 C-terminal